MTQREAINYFEGHRDAAVKVIDIHKQMLDQTERVKAHFDDMIKRLQSGERLEDIAKETLKRELA